VVQKQALGLHPLWLSTNMPPKALVLPLTSLSPSPAVPVTINDPALTARMLPTLQSFVPAQPTYAKSKP
jgi:hypothetical protein